MHSALAQAPVQTVRGRVLDALTGQPLPGTRLALWQQDTLRQASSSDAQGHFAFERVPTGRYQLRAERVGYATFRLAELLVEAGKETVLTCLLRESQQRLDEVVISGDPGSDLARHAAVSRIELPVEQVRRFPATFYDPARLLAAYPGVVGAHDQGNNVSVRGNSPNSLRWRLEGVDIVNPNHLANAGTLSDRPTLSGGGVNMLSAQLLGNSSFLVGAFPVGYGNALGGVYDMRLRAGNNRRRETTLQAGVIGLDLATEGPFRLGKADSAGAASYLINYRYSTVGLLAAMGVPLGDEDIRFQDLALRLTLPTARLGTFTFFGLGGNNRNVFEADRDSTTWEIQKDRFDIRFASRLGAAGLTHAVPVGRGRWQSTVAASALRTTRTADLLTDDLQPQRVENDLLEERKYALATHLEQRAGLRTTWRVGLQLTQEEMALTALGGPTSQQPGALVTGQLAGWLWQPFAEMQYALLPQLSLQGGLHTTHFSFNQTQAWEPRASILWLINQRQDLRLAYGQHSQLQAPGVYLATFADADGALAQPNRSLDFTRAHHYVLSYQHRWLPALRLRAEVYYQDLYRVPVAAVPNSFSALNLLDGFAPFALANTGTGENYGLDVVLEQLMDRDYYFVLSGSLYESKYRGSDGIRRDTRFNGNYVVNATAGKEWAWPGRRDRSRQFGINGRAVYFGGWRETPLDRDASRQQQATIADEARAFENQLADYYKLDLRLLVRRERPRYTRTLALDLQNVTNRRNEAFRTYDFLRDEVVVQRQLGIIPVLTYRVDF